jgi:hypothetical protein
MSSIHQRLTTAATDTRLAVVISAAVNLKAQLCELNCANGSLKRNYRPGNCRNRNIGMSAALCRRARWKSAFNLSPARTGSGSFLSCGQ